MKVLFYMGHPAHFHLFKNTITALKEKGHQVSVLIKKKDILEDLLQRSGMEYHNILPEGRKDSRAGLLAGMIKRDFRLLKFCIRNRPDLMLGTSVEIGHVGTLLRIPTINVNEDDADVVPFYSKLGYPWSKHILSPSVCNNGKWDRKTIKYEGYHELAYLHPDHFTPSKEVAGRYVTLEKPYFIMRFAKLNAHHDRGISGINDALAADILSLLKQSGNIYITSERKLDSRFEQYRLEIDPLEIHHVMAFATLYIGDSQTMAAESGVLGVPFIRYNDFVGRIGYLKELEEKYELGFGIKATDPEKVMPVLKNLLNMEGREEIFRQRQKKMLDEKINLALFLLRLVENYPVYGVNMLKT